MKYIITILMLSSCSQLTCFNKDTGSIGKCSGENIFNTTRCKTVGDLTACETTNLPKTEDVTNE